MRRSRVRFLVAAPEALRGWRVQLDRVGAAGRFPFRLRTLPAGGRGARAAGSRRCISLTRGLRKRTISRLLCWSPGGVPEWPKGPDCKSDGSAFVGSNPTPSTTARSRGPSGCFGTGFERGVFEPRVPTRGQGEAGCRRTGGYSSVVEPQPSKLMARVQSPLPAPCDTGEPTRMDANGMGEPRIGVHERQPPRMRNANERSHSSVGRARPW